MQRYVAPPAGHVSKKGVSVLTVVARPLFTVTVVTIPSVQPAKKCGTDHLRLNAALRSQQKETRMNIIVWSQAPIDKKSLLQKILPPLGHLLLLDLQKERNGLLTCTDLSGAEQPFPENWLDLWTKKTIYLDATTYVFLEPYHKNCLQCGYEKNRTIEVCDVCGLTLKI
jgi:hypothetical protein